MTEPDVLVIDGSSGEGGGQIIRSCLSLAMVLQRPVQITQIRAKRSRPGLQRQHLTAVRAAAEICRAQVQGAALGSSVLSFRPGEVRGGDYSFDIGSAGSTTLVLQTLLPPLMLAAHRSRIQLEGGTHNPLAPPFDFLERTFLPLVNRMGPTVSARLERYGFYPAGRGRMVVEIDPSQVLTGLELLERSPIIGRQVIARVANLPHHIAQRECDTIRQASGWAERCFRTDVLIDVQGPGNIVSIDLQSRELTEVFSAIGEKGVPAERVAQRAFQLAQDYEAAQVPVGEWLADQLILPCGLAAHQGSPAAFRTHALSGHATTHVELLSRFLNVQIGVESATENGVTVRFLSRER